MNLKRRLILGSAASIVLMCVIAAVSFVLLKAMEFSVLSVTEEYTELQDIGAALGDFATARAALTADTPRVTEAIEALGRAHVVLASFVEIQDTHAGADESHHVDEAAAGLRMNNQIQELLTMLRSAPTNPDRKQVTTSIAAVDELRRALADLASGANRLVEDSLADTHRQLTIASTALVACCAIGSIIVVILAYFQHRWIVMPIVALRDRVHRAVTRRGPSPVPPTADLLGEIDSSFDGLVRELDGLYASLEDRIRSKSRELVRSERLASVGYLAAGVAHEINNPLNAILGYTELTLRELDSGNGSPRPAAVDSLTVIRDETMRCKHTVEKLLALVRKSDAPRETVDVAVVIREVVTMVDGLKQFRGRTIRVEGPDSAGEPLRVLAREAELKQVMVNLIVNALEATSPGDGEVVVRTQRRDGNVLIEVRDNGHGMTPAALGRVFEPFFTEKRGGTESGTGLGLAIVHAIIEDHGGTIEATSDGPAQGSVFIVSLPVCEGEEAAVDGA